MLFSVLDVTEFNRVKSFTNANDIWKKLMEIHEGTSSVKEAKLYLLKCNFSEFTMKKDESIAEMFNRLVRMVRRLFDNLYQKTLLSLVDIKDERRTVRP